MNSPRSIFRARQRDRGAERYIPQALDLARRNPHLFRPGMFGVVEIVHDDDCQRPNGGACTCTPVVRLAGDPDAN